MRVLIVAPNISTRMGGEAVLPYHYIRELNARGVDVHAVTHERVEAEIETSDIADAATFCFVKDTFAEKFIYRVGKMFPAPLRETVFNALIGVITMARISHAARRRAETMKFDVVHQPTPVSPTFPAFLKGVAAPTVIGPLNGGMSYPPAFSKTYAKGTNAPIIVARALASVANKLFPGKRDAARVLAANDRTLQALPSNVAPSRTALLVENGVDLSLWSPETSAKPDEPTFVFVGRLVWWKAVDLLIEAFAQLNGPARLLIIGDGPERARLEALAAERADGDKRIVFSGFQAQPKIRDALATATALVLPSMRECGGAVILEAFACRTPAIATDWGGPQDYVTPETGILAPPDSREDFIDQLRAAMQKLGDDKALAARMGEAARRRIEERYSWRAKAARMIAIYRDVQSAAEAS